MMSVQRYWHLKPMMIDAGCEINQICRLCTLWIVFSENWPPIFKSNRLLIIFENFASI